MCLALYRNYTYSGWKHKSVADTRTVNKRSVRSAERIKNLIGQLYDNVVKTRNWMWCAGWGKYSNTDVDQHSDKMRCKAEKTRFLGNDFILERLNERKLRQLLLKSTSWLTNWSWQNSIFIMTNCMTKMCWVNLLILSDLKRCYL